MTASNNTQKSWTKCYGHHSTLTHTDKSKKTTTITCTKKDETTSDKSGERPKPPNSLPETYTASGRHNLICGVDPANTRQAHGNTSELGK